MKHNSITLELRRDKPDNVWRYVYDWRQLPSGHGDKTSYLLVHALVQWGLEKDIPRNAFCILMQYSSQIGEDVDITEPAHILEGDAVAVASALKAFIEERLSKR